ncbi:hypothetical protein C8P68_102410 [Mucilaginibacter yixingensis]|uniref:DUF2059 domain-containing protein n=1 Tax=Mucilaginibacter yixingensis TaxID=1295612 RepID=A0A2T5JD38_9SPHI|nr:DUF2059 domain-containing protein [Mucilaginibacter yixingensis]PTQ99585.1 hypothetical protein C8P68_102410 [Mucilaginibacter yixingensis]
MTGLRSILLIIFFSIAIGASAQIAKQPKSAALANPPSAAALKAAETMLLASGADKDFDQNMSAMIDEYAARVPADKLQQFKKTMRLFVDKYCSWAVLKNDFCMMYAREFTEAELRQMVAFYTSPTGKKLLEKRPLLFDTSALLGRKAFNEHRAEMEQMLQDALK